MGWMGEWVYIPVTRTTLADMFDEVCVCIDVEWMDV